MTYKPKAVSIFLNSICPRKCPYCDVVDTEKEKNRLHTEDWKKAFKILESKGTEFYLILGTEPLMMGDEIVDLVDFWNKNGYEYGFYSTSPEPQFSKLSPKLRDVKIRNWSSGIDYLPSVDNKELSRKATESIRGMKKMEDIVEETHALITISKDNISQVPDLVKYLVDNIKNIHIGMNFVEYSKEDKMDFAKKEGSKYFFTEGDEIKLSVLNSELRTLPWHYKKHIQTPLNYFDNTKHILDLDWHCNLEDMAMGVDSDGSLRLCGYKQLDKKHSVFDLETKSKEIFREVERNWRNCEGCYWAYPYILQELGIDGVDYKSDYWKERLK